MRGDMNDVRPGCFSSSPHLLDRCVCVCVCVCVKAKANQPSPDVWLMNRLRQQRGCLHLLLIATQIITPSPLFPRSARTSRPYRFCRRLIILSFRMRCSLISDGIQQSRTGTDEQASLSLSLSPLSPSPSLSSISWIPANIKTQRRVI